MSPYPMLCMYCGTQLVSTDRFCSKCGQPATSTPPPAEPQSYQTPAEAVQAPPPVQPQQPQTPAEVVQTPVQPQPAQSPVPAIQAIPTVQAPQTQIPAAATQTPITIQPSLYSLACPQCGNRSVIPTGKDGSTGTAIAKQLAFGAIGNIVTSSNAQYDLKTEPIKYKCKQCNNKFVCMPHAASPEELLSAPCLIRFQRISNVVGMAIVYVVYLNGVNMGAIKNGKTLEFYTYIRYNSIFVTDPHGVAFADMFRFEAMPGGIQDVRFNRRFLI